MICIKQSDLPITIKLCSSYKASLRKSPSEKGWLLFFEFFNERKNTKEIFMLVTKNNYPRSFKKIESAYNFIRDFCPELNDLTIEIKTV